MRAVERLVLASAPLRRDGEDRRWYTEGADNCLVLTKRRRLLEPHPVFGPTHYRLLACRVTRGEAQAYARNHGFSHERLLRPRS